MERTESAISRLQTPEAQGLFTGLLRTEEFEFGLAKLEEFLRQDRVFVKPAAMEEFTTLRSRLAGFFFEQIAYAFMAKEIGDNGDNQVLLSPRQTDALYRWRFDRLQDRFYEHGGFRLGIPGITVPDGIVFDVAQNSGREEFVIAFICEYKLTIKPRRSDKRGSQAKYHASPNRFLDDLFQSAGSLTNQVMLSEELSEVVGIPRTIRLTPDRYQGVVYVLPSPKNEEEEGLIEARLRKDRISLTPFSSREFGRVLTVIINNTADAVGIRIPAERVPKRVDK